MPDEPLRRAYEERSRDLLDARTGLAEAVAALTAELRARRDEIASVLGENDALRGLAERSEREAAAQQQRAEAAEAALAAVRGMRIVRYSAPARRLVYRLRSLR